jgi:hypothetical protein
VRVLVCGSRDWNDQARIAARIVQLPEGTVVLHGTARGADIIAARYAEGLGYEVEHWPADWEKYGKRAGIVRNIDMLGSGVDLVIAFWDGKSRGTKHTFTEARRRGITVEVHNPHYAPLVYGSPVGVNELVFPDGSWTRDRGQPK